MLASAVIRSDPPTEPLEIWTGAVKLAQAARVKVVRAAREVRRIVWKKVIVVSFGKKCECVIERKKVTIKYFFVLFKNIYYIYVMISVLKIFESK